MAQLRFARGKTPLDAQDVVILATPAYAAKALLPALNVPEEQHSAIMLHFAADHREPPGSMRVLTHAACDRLRYDAGVIRAELHLADPAWHSDPPLLAARVWKQIRALHPALPAALPEWAIWREKRAGHVPTAAPLPRPSLPPRLLLAGDWLDATRAGTLETAAASGHAAAARAMALLGKQPAPTQYDFYLH